MNNNIPREIKILRKKEGEKSVQVFASTYFPHYLTNKTCSFHEELYGFLLEAAHKKGQYIAIAAPRGSAKSSIVSLCYVLWCICYKKESYIVILSETNDQAVRLLSNIKSELEGNKYLMRDFPEICEIGQNQRPVLWKDDEIITRNRVMITALGVGQKIRGRRHKEHRPSLIILDDVEGDESVKSQDKREKLFNWFNKAVLKAGDEATNIIAIGTILDYDSLLAKLVSNEQTKKWQAKTYRSIISDASNIELWAEWSRILNYEASYKDKEGREAADLFFEDHKEEMLKGAKVLWPEKEDYYTLMLMRDYNEASFDSEKQNDPSNPNERKFNMDEAYYWDDEYKSEEDLFKAIGEDLEIYGACDPSLGIRGKHGDYSAIITLARNKKTNIIYVLDADIKRRSLEELYEAIINCCEDRRYNKFVIESNGFQEALVDEIISRCEERGISVLIEGIKNTSDKKGRIELLQSPIEKGRIKFSRKHVELLKQLKYFPKGSHDDGPDALEMAVRICKSEVGQRKIRWLDLNGEDDDDDIDYDRPTQDPNERDYGSQYDDTNDGEDD